MRCGYRSLIRLLITTSLIISISNLNGLLLGRPAHGLAQNQSGASSGQGAQSGAAPAAQSGSQGGDSASAKPIKDEPAAQTGATPPAATPAGQTQTPPAADKPADSKDQDKKAQGGGATPTDKPVGAAGKPTVKPKEPIDENDPNAVSVPDRWRIGFPDDPRLYRGRLLNPYRQNVLKGDYPVKGQDIFLNLSATSNSDFEYHRLPTGSDVGSVRPGSQAFFGRGEQFAFSQEFDFTVDLFKGDTAFKPVDWEFRISPSVNVNYLRARENGVVNVDVSQGRTRTDSHVGLQEAFFELKLSDNPRLLPFLGRKDGNGRKSPYYDFTSIRVGTQRFTSDFRGFIFADEEPGVRLFGNSASNRNQWNVAYFYMLEKNTNSGLNTFQSRHQNVYIANFYRQDFLAQGWTNSWSFHYNNDRAGRLDSQFGQHLQFDDNDFLVRPAAVGDFTPHNINVAYFGWTSDGHIGKYNVAHALYWAVGNDSHNPIAGRQQKVDGQMAAIELSIDRDYLKPKVSFFYSSGDKDPRGSVGRGFDSIIDQVNFAGGGIPGPPNLADRGFANPIIPQGTSFFNREPIPLSSSGVGLFQPNSLIPDLRSSKIEGQTNFVNPGIFLANAGLEAKLTPKLDAQINLNYSQFVRVEPLQLILFQRTIRHSIGWDYSMSAEYRPLLHDNIVITGGMASLVPGQGFRDIYTSRTLFTFFLGVKFVF